MGYTTDFNGRFNLNRELTKKDLHYLIDFSVIRHVVRHVEPEFGVDGEFYVRDDKHGIVDNNKPPRTQPGLYCQWTPTADGMGIAWDGNEKFYYYIEWLKYLVDKILSPRGYVLNGEVTWFGEEHTDTGIIIVKNNVITVKTGEIVYK